MASATPTSGAGETLPLLFPRAPDPPAAPGEGAAARPEPPPASAPARLVEVVLNLPVEKAFHYRVPDGMPLPGEGVRVRVPFGRRKELAFCVGHPGAPDVAKLKDVIDVVDERPLVRPAMMRLTRWIAAYYGCSWGEALHAAVPGGVRRGARGKSVSHAVLVHSPEEARREMEEREARFPAQARLLDILLAEGGEAPVSRLRQATRSASPLRTLQRRGIVRLEEREAEDDVYSAPVERVEPTFELTVEQAAILERLLWAVRAKEFAPYLIHGVTGSGKTEIYIRAILETVAAGRDAILLVPEISLTPQTVRWFRERMPGVAVLHSHLSDGQRAEQWRAISEGEARVVIGSRSAVFAPVRDLGLVIVDEEHEASFKQDSTPRYHARDVAIVRAREEGAVVALGSATPSLESYRNAIEGKYTLLTLDRRVTPNPLPEVDVVDMTKEFAEIRRPTILSRHLKQRLQETLDAGEQAILFLNRRGFATMLRCSRCGEVLGCRQCDISLTFHKGRQRAVCHYCYYQVPVGETCPECLTGKIRAFGLGTEKVMEAVERNFPNVRAARMDSDSMQGRDAYRRTLADFDAGEIRILVGTQMITKGLHFPQVTFVGVVSADMALHLPDFRASERTFQLLCQVSGRAGRGDRAGRVVIQTFSPFHTSIRAAVGHDYRTFYDNEIETRAELRYPPFGRLLRLLLQGRKEAAVRKEAETIAERLRALAREVAARSSSGGGGAGGAGDGEPAPVEPTAAALEVLGPAPCPISRIQGAYRWQVAVKAPGAAAIRAALTAVRPRIAQRGPVRVVADVDPVGLL